MAPQQDRAEVTRSRIVAAGVELFGDHGFGLVDMVDVIGRAGVSKGACYYHFPNKHSLATAIVEESNAKIAAAMAPVWESVAPAMHRLIDATFRFLELTASDPVVRIGYRLRQAMRQNRASGERHLGDTEVLFTDCLKRGVKDGHLRPDVDPGQTAYTLFTALVGCQQLAEPFGDDPMARFTEVWDVVLRGIAADGQREALDEVVRSASRRRSTTAL